jgi:hypothetical protein
VLPFYEIVHNNGNFNEFLDNRSCWAIQCQISERLLQLLLEFECSLWILSYNLTEKEQEEENSTLKKKVAAEKKQREHLLQLNQILAKQVMEKS